MSIEVEVYASVSKDHTKKMLISMKIPLGSTVRDVIEKSKIMDFFDETKNEVEDKIQDEVGEKIGNAAKQDIQSLAGRIGIFGKLCSLENVLQHGDRIEIYQALKRDPKEARRQRAKMARREKKDLK